jgi:DNA-binding transcriptional regulator YhcF (GntR family)
MKRTNFLDLIRVDEYSSTPKYLQIAHSLVGVVKSGDIAPGAFIPSINELSFELDIARNTVERGYNHLRNIGVIEAVPGRGFYIRNNRKLRSSPQIFLLFNKLSTHKKAIYDSFVQCLGENADVDFYVYNNDGNIFRKLLSQKKERYSHYVIIPHLNDEQENFLEIIQSIPRHKLVLLDKMVPGLHGNYGAVYENFEHDIYNVLVEASDRLTKYRTIKILFPTGTYYPAEIIKGLKTFCVDHLFDYKVVSNIKYEPINEGDVFIQVLEDDLMALVERISATNLTIGKQVGLISYNETPLKKIALNGITTISTDFEEMGRTAADLVLSNSRRRIQVPFKLTLRQSL